MPSYFLVKGHEDLDTAVMMALKFWGLYRFAGSSVLEEDNASRRLEVDENGLPKRMSNDIWNSNATSR